MSMRRKIRAVAIIILLGYAVLRFVFVQAVFESYGVNAWVFLAIDAGTAVIYVLGIEYLIVSLKAELRSWPRLLFWAFVTLVAFAAPYVYIYQSSRELPWTLGVGLVLVVGLLLVNAIVGLRRRLKKKPAR